MIFIEWERLSRREGIRGEGKKEGKKSQRGIYRKRKESTVAKVLKNGVGW